MDLMLLFMFLSITVTEGFKDWSEITHQMYTPDCNLQPQIPIYMMSGKELFSSHEMECKLTRNQGVCNIREGDVHKVRDTNLAGVSPRGKLSLLEFLQQQSNVEGLQARCAYQDQHRVRVYDVVLQSVDVLQSVSLVRSVRRYQPGVIDYEVAPHRVDITNVAVLDPG